jgi:hypothetical protein
MSPFPQITSPLPLLLLPQAGASSAVNRHHSDAFPHTLRDDLANRIPIRLVRGGSRQSRRWAGQVMSAEGWTSFTTRRKKANAGGLTAAPSAKAKTCAIGNEVEAMRGELNRICTYSNLEEEIKLGRLYI